MRAEAPKPSIRGSFITTGKAWIIRTYGADLFERALAVLPAEQQALFRFELVSTSWYPIQEWTQVLDAVKDQVRKKTGEDGATFDRRSIFEAINGTMDQIFRIAFGIVSPTTVVAKITPYFQRVYSHGEYSVVENQLGRCRLRLREVPPDMDREVRRAFPLAASWMLDVAGQVVTRSDLAPAAERGLVSYDLTLDYQPKKKQ